MKNKNKGWDALYFSPSSTLKLLTTAKCFRSGSHPKMVPYKVSQNLLRQLYVSMPSREALHLSGTCCNSKTALLTLHRPLFLPYFLPRWKRIWIQILHSEYYTILRSHSLDFYIFTQCIHMGCNEGEVRKMLEWFVMTDIKFIYRIRNRAGKPQSVGPVKSTELPFTRSNLSMS